MRAMLGRSISGGKIGFILLIGAGLIGGFAQAFMADPETNNWRRESSSFLSSNRSSSKAANRRNSAMSPTRLSSLSASMEPMDPIRQRSTAIDKPPVTETAAPLPELDKLPVSHKIVVLGATGKVGRLLVRQLLEDSPDGTLVVAVVRDYDKVSTPNVQSLLQCARIPSTAFCVCACIFEINPDLQNYIDA